jgi:lysozyme family protein
VIDPRDPFQQFINFVLRPDIEGGLSMDPRDAGNWTTGKVGAGTLNGTKFGISAAAYPGVDIQKLTTETVKPLYFADYWTKAGCHMLPPALAFLTADAAVQHGPAQAVKLLQRALGVKDDGECGPQTYSAARVACIEHAVDETLAQRIKFYIQLPPKDDIYAGGWSRRLVKAFREVV